MGAVGVGWAVSWLVASTRAVGLSDGSIGEGTSAWAVGDSQGGGLSDSVGVVVLHDGGWVWAVCGILGDDLSGGPFGLIAVVSRDGSNGEGSSEDG